MTERRRNFFVLLLVLGLIALSAAVVSTQPTKLGLDLRGGVSLTYQAQPTKQVKTITTEDMQRSLDILRKRVDALGVAEPEIQQVGQNQLNVALPGLDDPERAEGQVGDTAQLFFYDWEQNLLDDKCEPLDPTEALGQSPIVGFENAVKIAAKCNKTRIGDEPREDADNTTPNQWYVFDGEGRIAEGSPADSREAALADLPGRAVPAGGHLYEVPEGVKVIQTERPDNMPESLPTPDRWFVIKDDPELSGTDITNPEQQFDQGGGSDPIVTFTFTDKGRKAFQDVTRRIAQRGAENALPGADPIDTSQHFAIVLDDELVSRPFINWKENPDGIDGANGAQISGGFTIESAQDLARFLKIGALPVKLELISRSQVSATLGAQALDQGLTAGIAGFVIVALFLIVFYRVLGLIATGALGVYALYFFALIKIIPITLTLPGIAGLILTIGVAADANIVIFERVKEEIRAGRSIAGGIAQGYKKGLATIIDANIVTLLVAFILFMLATAGVKGFAFTLGVGVIVSFLTAYIATQAVLLSMRNSRVLSSKAALGAEDTDRKIRFNFMGASKYFFSASGVILLVCAFAIAAKGVNFGIDFESGTKLQAPVPANVTVDRARDVLEPLGYGSAKIQTADDPDLGKVLQLSVEKLPPAEVDELRVALERAFNEGQRFENFDQESVGPTFGETVANSAVIAIIASLIVISAYIALRFEWKYAVPVLIALMHDLLITAGIYALLGLEVTTSTVAALLTILGFSLYDTIIVFDRIRENVPRMPTAAYSQIVNRSMSEVIVRSLATSFCTVLPVLTLAIFGGETLQAFAIALIVGTASGTYSSVFIAAPVLCHWKERELQFRAREAKIVSVLGKVPAYADEMKGLGPVDVVPVEKKRPARVVGEPGEVSAEEFEEMVRQLHVEEPAAATAGPSLSKLAPGGSGPAVAAPGGQRGGRRARRAATPPPQPPAASGETPAPPAPSQGDGETKPGRSSSTNPASRRTRKKHGRPR